MQKPVHPTCIRQASHFMCIHGCTAARTRLHCMILWYVSYTYAPQPGHLACSMLNQDTSCCTAPQSSETVTSICEPSQDCQVMRAPLYARCSVLQSPWCIVAQTFVQPSPASVLLAGISNAYAFRAAAWCYFPKGYQSTRYFASLLWGTANEIVTASP